MEMMSLQRLPGLLELIFLIAAGFFYFIYVLKISYIAIVLRTNFRAVFVKLIMRSIYFLLILISLLAPSFGDVKREIKSIGKDIYFLIDLSASMNTADIAPTRLEKTKFELRKVADAFASDRLGIIIFSSDAYVQCPLTFDLSAFYLFLETLNTSLVPATGTDFAPALETALKRFKNAETSTTSTNSKICVLVSDGEDFGDETEDVAYSLKREGIKTFTVGVGTPEGGRVPNTDGSYKKDKNGHYAISKLNSDALKKLAEITDGNYYEISNKRNDVPKLIKDIQAVEGELRDVKTIDASSNKYFYFLIVALALIVLDVILTVKTLRI